MKLSARRGLECRILHHLSQNFWGPPDRRGLGAANRCAVRINLPATFQFSPATSKSIDIPDTCKQFQCNFTIAVTVDSTVPVVFFALIFLTYLPDSQI
jgi:hypothetical protein